MNDQDLTKTDYDPDRSLVLIEGLSHFLTNFLQNLASCQTNLRNEMQTLKRKKYGNMKGESSKGWSCFLLVYLKRTLAKFLKGG
jgi:hypothetical protein